MSKNQEKGLLLESDERFKLLVESVQDYAIFILDVHGNVASWNPGAQSIKGYSEEEILGKHFSEFYTPEDKAAGKPQRELETARAQGRVEDEGWRVRKDGSRFWALAVLTAIRGKNGEISGFAKVTRDRTDHKEAELRLRASEEQFRMLVEGVEEYAIYMLDPIGHVTTWNTGAEKLKRYRAQEIIGKTFASFYTSEDVAEGKPQRNLEEAKRKGHIRDQGLRVRKDGSTFQAEVVLTALRDASGTIRGFSKVTRDITDQVQSRETEAAKIAAETSNKAKDDFLATLSHELRTPLTPILAAASFLVENASKIPPEFNDELDMIRRNIQLEARLIDDLLDLTRISRGKIVLRRERVDAHSVIRETLAMVRPEIVEKALQVSTDLSAKQHYISADPVRMQQVFWNLINNAVKFTGPGGKIAISTANDNGHFQLEITDDGIGIELERQRVLFNAFEQGERFITRQFGGLGLGLAIAKNLLDLHGGSIAAESGGRGCGASFKVTLDALTDQAEIEKQMEENLPANSRALRILLVEDHGDTRRILSRLLTHCGHDISVAECLETALDLVRSTEFDAVVSDIGLPDGTGYDLMLEARKTQTLTGVALTGFGMDEDIQRSKDAGFAFHLTKPVDFHELRTVLKQIAS